eukprot:4158381-Amphidinium_carterae.1
MSREPLFVLTQLPGSICLCVCLTKHGAFERSSRTIVGKESACGTGRQATTLSADETLLG